MKVVRVCGSYYPAKKMGGAVTADFTLDRAFVEKCFTVQVLTTTAGLEKEQESSYETIDGVAIRRFSYLGNVNFSISLRMLIDIWRVVGSLEGVVILSGIWNLPTLLGPLICRFRSVPYVITTHGSLYFKLIRRKRSGLKKFLMWAVVSRNLKAALAIHFTVEAERRAAEFLFGGCAIASSFRSVSLIWW